MGGSAWLDPEEHLVSDGTETETELVKSGCFHFPVRKVGSSKLVGRRDPRRWKRGERSKRGVTFCLFLPEAVADLVNAGRVYHGEIR